MSKVWGRIASLFSNRTFAGMDKAGNRYFARNVEIDGIMKEKRWVVFKGEEDPTSVPVEWICWLNGQRKKAPTAEELIELEVRRERVRLNVALLKKEEEERRVKEGIAHKGTSTAKVGGPDLKSFIRQFPPASKGDSVEEASEATDGTRKSSEIEADKKVPSPAEQPESSESEPTGSGAAFRPGTWQPPT